MRSGTPERRYLHRFLVSAADQSELPHDDRGVIPPMGSLV